MGYFSSIYAADLPHRAVAVYMYLKDRTNKEGACWPSIKTIARELKLSRATISSLESYKTITAANNICFSLCLKFFK